MTGVEAKRQGRLKPTASPVFTSPFQTASALPSIRQAFSRETLRTRVTWT
jgi:hypothetical protein